jgi:hypothetical protein
MFGRRQVEGDHILAAGQAGGGMRRLSILILPAAAAGYSRTGAVIYEGARLIMGDLSAPIENGAFVGRPEVTC